MKFKRLVFKDTVDRETYSDSSREETLARSIGRLERQLFNANQDRDMLSQRVNSLNHQLKVQMQAGPTPVTGFHHADVRLSDVDYRPNISYPDPNVSYFRDGDAHYAIDWGTAGTTGRCGDGGPTGLFN